MRGIAMTWPPPEGVYPDGQAQVSLRQVETAYRAALAGEPDKAPRARSEFDRLDKQMLRRKMWRPLSLDPGLALHWMNLYLSCPSLDTCDSSKGDQPFRWDNTDPQMPWPVDLRYEDFVGFTKRGEIYVRRDVPLTVATRRALELAIADRPDGARVRRGIANLNHPALVAARAAAVDGERMRMEKDFRNRTATRDQREERASALLGRGQLPAFVSIRVAWLRRMLGRGR